MKVSSVKRLEIGTSVTTSVGLVRPAVVATGPGGSGCGLDPDCVRQAFGAARPRVVFQGKFYVKKLFTLDMILSWPMLLLNIWSTYLP